MLLAAAPQARVCCGSHAAARPAAQLRLQSARPAFRMSTGARRRSAGAAATPASHPVVAAAAAADGVQGDMVDAPSAANKNIVRLLAVSAVVAAAARGTAYLPTAGIAFVHLLAYGSWLGAIVWTTFIAGIVMFKNLPRQMFGRVQSKLFPLYFGLSAAASTIQLGVLAFAAANAPQKQFVLLGIGLASSLLNLLIVEPQCTRVMFQRYDLENASGPRDEGAIKALQKQFGKWHGISSLINLATLVVAVGHGWWLASLLTGILA
ncbi:Transmembrane 205 [Micractinium conductrix]|uniref:Transmembrane 205 n=1 Tax=Micractinium conductrix TaxID=554055 RepID=A0A2P6VJT2_9CHLO|nr:Transmembrane 205 [Micractinium conductrix]|eukprot:PSC74334.1 Transmembrane 205 [Micractinium conductrix]